MHRLAIAAALSLAMFACTAPNASVSAVDAPQGDPDDAPVTPDADDDAAVPPAGGAPSCPAPQGPHVPTGDVRRDDPATCESWGETTEAPDCAGGLREVATDGAVVCTWACLHGQEVVGVAVRTAAGCWAIDDMRCRVCADHIAAGRDAAELPCMDVGRLMW